MRLKARKYFSATSNKQVDHLSYLTLDKEYIALGLDFDNPKLAYIEADNGQPAYVNIDSFEILSNSIPSAWVVDYNSKLQKARLFPKTWLEANSFWEKLINQEDPKIVNLYCNERDKIYAEEP